MKGIKSPVSKLTMRPRLARHGKLLADVYRVRTEEVSKVVTKQDPKTGEFTTKRVVVQQAVDRPMTDREIEEHRNNVVRALGPTTPTAGRNTGGAAAGKKKVKG